MNIDRIKEIQRETAYPESISVQQALLKVWNETEQEQFRIDVDATHSNNNPMTKDNTRPMTVDEYYDSFAVFDFKNPIGVIDPGYIFDFAKSYAYYLIQFQRQQCLSLDPFEGAPEWAQWRVANGDGSECWHENQISVRANIHLGIFISYGREIVCPDRRLIYNNWRQSPVKRNR